MTTKSIELPIILVTAKNHLGNLAEGLETGANDFLPKPFHKQELKSRVENQLKLSLMHRTSKENIRLRSFIKSYSEADRELRHSRMQLQQVLETIDEGFIAFELPGHIFSFNKTTTDLLGTDRKTLEGAEIASVFKKSLNSENCSTHSPDGKLKTCKVTQAIWCFRCRRKYNWPFLTATQTSLMRKWLLSTFALCSSVITRALACSSSSQIKKAQKRVVGARRDMMRPSSLAY